MILWTCTGNGCGLAERWLVSCILNSGVQVLYGDVQEAICHHALYYSMWRKGGLVHSSSTANIEFRRKKFFFS
jgi:hypothetical protein